MFNLEQSFTLMNPSQRRMAMDGPLLEHIENARKFVAAAIAGPLVEDPQREKLLNGLKGKPEEVLEYETWITAGSEAWAKCLSSSS